MSCSTIYLESTLCTFCGGPEICRDCPWSSPRDSNYNCLINPRRRIADLGFRSFRSLNLVYRSAYLHHGGISTPDIEFSTAALLPSFHSNPTTCKKPSLSRVQYVSSYSHSHSPSAHPVIHFSLRTSSLKAFTNSRKEAPKPLTAHGPNYRPAINPGDTKNHDKRYLPSSIFQRTRIDAFRPGSKERSWSDLRGQVEWT